MRQVRFKLLGPLEAWVGAEPLPLGGAKQRALIAVLLLRPNEAVSTDRLIDELWGERPPSSAAHSVEVYVSRLRKLFEEAGAGQVLVTRGHGYAAEIDPRDLDTGEFERLAEKGRHALASGDYGDASRLLREALTLWHGEPLAELGLEGASALAIGRLTDLRLAVVEDRIEADLALGRHGALVGELGALVREHPLRERLRRDLMLSLYRSGRQAEALEVYRDGRARLVGELGIEPGEELQRLQRGILRQDPSLAAPTRSVAGRSRLRVALAVAAALVLVGGGTAAAVLLATRGGSTRSARSLAPNSIGALSADGRLLGQVAGTATPTAAVAGAGSVWIASADDDTLSRIDDRSVQRTDQIVVGDRPGDVAFGENDVWVTNTATGTVSRIDPTADKVVQTVTVGSDPIGVAAGAGSIWVANSGDNTVTEIDGTSGHIVRTILINVPVRSVAYAAGAVWVTDPAGARVLRIDPPTGDVTASVPVGGGADAIASGRGSIWVANSDDGTVSRIDARTATLTATIKTGDRPHAFAVGRRDVWVGNEFGDTVVRIDPRTNLVARSIKLANRVEALAESGGRIFVATGAATGGHRGGTLTVIMSIIPFDTPDPALAYLPSSWNVLSMTNDGLVGFERVGGPDGTRLVPDLAEALPASTAHGTHYTFQLRSGIRYSDGTPVRPEDVRRALERVLELRSPGALYYAGIVGARRCLAQRRCDLSRGIAVDEDARTISFRLTRPDPEFLYKLALPFAFAVPQGMKAAAQTRPLPATGPYTITTYRPGTELVLRRNPDFREWSREAQPDGYPDVIVWRTNLGTKASLHAIATGRADLIAGGPVGPAAVQGLRRVVPRQFHTNLAAETIYAFLNTRVPPFDDVRVRRALNYAFDRHVVQKTLGPSIGTETCQILPAGFPGHAPDCPYTFAPSRNGEWVAPDLARARRLVRSSGKLGMRVTVWRQPTDTPELASYLASVLRQLGFRAGVRIVPARSYYSLIRDSRTKAQIGMDGWVFDYPSPSNFFLPTLSCASFRPATASNTNDAEFCDPAIDAQMRRAVQLESVDVEAANRLWARIDREIVDQAPWLPLYDSVWNDFVSRRVGNYQYNPQWHVLVDQLWVR